MPYPTATDYQRLANRYPDTLDCPCTRTSIPHHEFIVGLQVTAHHQACRTLAVENSLLIGSYANYEDDFIDGTDFKKWKNLFIRGLKQLCQIAEETTRTSIEMFQLSSMYAYRAIPPHVFNSEVNFVLNRFKETIPNAFEQTLAIIRASSQDNALVSKYSANWKYIPRGNTTFRATPITLPNGTLYESPRGFVYSCFLLESILLSSLSCFYSASCINQYRRLNYLEGTVERWTSTGLPIQLNSSATRFAIDDTIETMAYQLFIESWTSNVSYQKFFNACRPNYCTYSYRYRFDLLEILTTFLSVYGGLTRGLRLFTPRFVNICDRIRNRCHARVMPSSIP